jgi:hypothetical protein
MVETCGGKLFGGLALVLALSGCGDDEPGDDPVAQCKAMVNAYCSNVIDCLVEGDVVPSDERDDHVAGCKSDAQRAVDCSRAIGVSENYDDCVTRLKHPDCEAVTQSVQDGTLALPDTCNGVIGVQQ